VKPQHSLLKQIVRAEVDVERLRDLGVTLSADPLLNFEEPFTESPYQVLANDLAAGIVVNWTRGGEQSQLWASAVLACSNLMDLSMVAEHDLGELLLDLLWRMSAGRSIEDSFIGAVRVLAD
jgi:hypothetical protein